MDNFFTDIHKYLRFLEEVVIRVLENYNLKGVRLDGSTGVWLKNNDVGFKKICAMGVRASRWVTMHGLAFNIDVDLNYFNNIVPCGISDRGVTSLKQEGVSFSFSDVENLFKSCFQEDFDFNFVDFK